MNTFISDYSSEFIQNCIDIQILENSEEFQKAQAHMKKHNEAIEDVKKYMIEKGLTEFITENSKVTFDGKNLLFTKL